MCEHVPRKKLCVNTNFIILDLWIQNYGCLKVLGEVWGGRAWAGAKVKLTKVPKSGGRRKKKKRRQQEKMGLARGRWAAIDRWAALALLDCGVSFFQKIWILFYLFLEL
jgi:hypothetical protein